MPRPYKLGNKKVSMDIFDQEILRLINLGLNQKEIAQRQKISRWSVDRSMKRSINKQPEQVEQAQIQGEYQRLNNDSFRGLPEIAKWIDNFKARQVNYAPSINGLKAVCDMLQIYPSMLDGHYAQKWLTMQAGIKSKSQQRGHKMAIRNWLKFSQNMTDNQLQVLGLDAKHYEVGKWATVGLSESQIKKGIALLSADPRDWKTLLTFRLGVECCTPSQELKELKKSSFIKEDGILRTFRAKTGSFWSKYPDKQTAQMLLDSKTDQIFINGDFDYIIPRLKQIYKMVGANNEYFNMRPIHVLRHIGAQRLLRLTDYNRAVVAVLGGWEAEKTLEDHYGAVPNNVIHKIGGSLWKE